MILNPNEPFYQISQAAKLLGITSDRLRTYEEEGLIKPHRTKLKDGKRLFSENDINWLSIIRDLIKSGITIPAVRILLVSKLPNDSKFLKDKDKEILQLMEKLKKHPGFKAFTDA